MPFEQSVHLWRIMKTKQILVGKVKIGGGAPISIQSMCNTQTKDTKKTISQIKKLQKSGCEIIRVAVEDLASANACKIIRKNISIPLVADIHFDYRIALACAPYVDKLRINPGNIGSDANVKKVVEAAKKYNLPIRIGINLGSLEKQFEHSYGRSPKAMVKSAEKHIRLLEKHNFTNIVVSLKASDIDTTVKACRLFNKTFRYPQHLGITEAGTEYSGTIKSSIGIGILLYEGIGDTIRVSLSADPVKEIYPAQQILKFLNLRDGLNIVSCPTCSRVGIDVEKYALEIERSLSHMNSNKTIAVMGCVVNGLGEAKDADITIVGNKNKNPLLYVDHKFIKIIKPEKIIDEVKKYI